MNYLVYKSDPKNTATMTTIYITRPPQNTSFKQFHDVIAQPL